MESEGVIDVEAEGQREEALQAVLKCPNPPQVSQPTSPTQPDAQRVAESIYAIRGPVMVQGLIWLCIFIRRLVSPPLCVCGLCRRRSRVCCLRSARRSAPPTRSVCSLTRQPKPTKRLRLSSQKIDAVAHTLNQLLALARFLLPPPCSPAHSPSLPLNRW
jgi:hypothetical protein